MDRLTERDEFGNANIIEVDSAEFQLSLDFDDFNRVTNVLNKLAEYEDLEEQGKLLKLPCVVGDTVYVKMQFGGIAEAEVRDYTHFISCGFCIVVTSKSFDKQNIPFSEFGKTVFLTKSAAEQALKEREGKK